MADYWSMALDGGELIEAQGYPSQPAPIPRPPLADQRRRPAAAPPAADYWERATAPPEAPAPAPALPPSQPQQTQVQSEPDAPTWVQRRVQDIRGKQDPRYLDTPTIAQVTIREGINKPLMETGSWALGAEDEGMVPVYRDMLGDRFLGVEKDANGYPLIVYRGQDGQPQRAYVNKPGLDPQDMMRGFFGIAPFVGAGAMTNALMRGAGIGVRATGQAVTQGATSLGQDLGATVAGVGDLDPSRSAIKAGVAAAGGFGGELAGAGIAALYRRFITEPRLFDQAAGRLTAEGIEAARKAGIDPQIMTSELQKEFAKNLARSGNPRASMSRVMSDEFNIPRTRGELSADMPTLLREQHMRGGNYGDTAAQMMRSFDQGQSLAIENAAVGQVARGRPGIAQQIAPGRSATDYGKEQLGTAIRSNTQAALQTAKEAENAAWQQVPRNIKPADEALPLLTQRINDAVGEFDIMPDGVAARMVKQVGRFVRQEAPAKIDDILKTSPIGDVGKMRKMLTTTLADAKTPSDRMASGAVYDAFNTWAREAAEQGLLNGADAVGMANMTTARGISRQIHELFDGQKGTPGARILSDVLKKADSAEGIINALFTGPTAPVKNGTMSALQNLKQAYDTYLPADAAKAAWDDIRLAYFLRLVQTKGGEVVGVQQMQSNIKQALATQSSVAGALYTPEERAMLRRFIGALDGIEKKNPNKPWSGIAAGGIIKDMMNSLISAFGFNSVLARTVFNAAGGQYVSRAYGPVAASRATQQMLPAAPLPSYGGLGGGLGARSEE